MRTLLWTAAAIMFCLLSYDVAVTHDVRGAEGSAFVLVLLVAVGIVEGYVND